MKIVHYYVMLQVGANHLIIIKNKLVIYIMSQLKMVFLKQVNSQLAIIIILNNKFMTNLQAMNKEHARILIFTEPLKILFNFVKDKVLISAGQNYNVNLIFMRNQAQYLVFVLISLFGIVTK